jgi:hypothetical protein
VIPPYYSKGMNYGPCGQAKEGKFAPMVHVILSCWDLDFNKACLSWTWKICSSNHGKVMALAFDKVNLIIVNPPTCICWVIRVSQWLSHVFPKYLKVIEIDMVHVLGFIEGKQCFSYVVFLKNKAHNRLNNHLHLVVSMYTHKFSHLAPFHTRLHIRCGLMFNQQMAKDNMLEFC